MSVLGINDLVCNAVPLVLFLYHVRPNSPIGLNESTYKLPFVNTFLHDKYLLLIVVLVLVG
jgi:hypothetical protein